MRSLCSIGSQSVGQIAAALTRAMLLADTELDGQMELEYLTALARNHVAGIILLGYDFRPRKALKDA